ncbi:MAG TPA: hypothetical protein VII05_01540 [Gaiellaceae bacterium]
MNVLNTGATDLHDSSRGDCRYGIGPHRPLGLTLTVNEARAR